MLKFRLIFVFFMLLVFSTIIFANATISEPTQSPIVKYRLFRTTNIWTFLKLDTITGKMWQIKFDVMGNNRGAVKLNTRNLAIKKKKVLGRFTLYPTRNMYTFILVDQIDGRVWQVQWSFNSMNRLVLPIINFK